MPPQVDEAELRKLHDLTRRGKHNWDWSLFHSSYVQQWNDRRWNIPQHLTEENPYTPHPRYMEWYRARTVTHIDHPQRRFVDTQGYQGGGSTLEYMYDGVSMAHHMSQSTLDRGQPSISDVMQFRDHTANMLDYVHQTSRMDYNTPPPPHPDHVQYVDYRADRRQPRDRRPRQGGRRPHHRQQAVDPDPEPNEEPRISPFPSPSQFSLHLDSPSQAGPSHTSYYHVSPSSFHTPNQFRDTRADGDDDDGDDDDQDIDDDGDDDDDDDDDGDGDDGDGDDGDDVVIPRRSTRPRRQPACGTGGVKCRGRGH